MAEISTKISITVSPSLLSIVLFFLRRQYSKNVGVEAVKPNENFILYRETLLLKESERSLLDLCKVNIEIS